jgi:hypothetical protein
VARPGRATRAVKRRTSGIGGSKIARIGGVRSQKRRGWLPSLDPAASEMFEDVTCDESLHGGFR